MKARTQAIRLKLQGLTYEQIGNKLGISLGQAQVLIRPSAPTRKLVKQRAEGKCENCGTTLPNGQYHHKSSKTTVAAFNQAENLEYLCPTCHGYRRWPTGHLARAAGNSRGPKRDPRKGEAFLEVCKQHPTFAAIGRHLGITRQRVKQLADRHGVKSVKTLELPSE